MMLAERYRGASIQLFDQAMIELEAGDARQASEKLWGAVAQALKSVAEERGWNHGSHAEFYRIVSRIVDETDEEEIGSWFRTANELHINFYEAWMRENAVRQSVDHVDRLIKRLSELV